jgi:hypothetical protein
MDETNPTDEMHPLLKDRLHRQRSVFSPGHRIRMNVLPMFLNIFVPWGLFIFVMSVNAFKINYERPGVGVAFNVLIVAFWVAMVLTAINRRKYDPDPTWFTFFAVVSGISILAGWMVGKTIFEEFTLPYYQIKDLKVISYLDASKENGQNVMDAGIVYFADENKIDMERSWHFKQDTVYCVAPIIKGEPGQAVPETSSFDFWAVGKDCCSESASDFRCGAYDNPMARSALRMLGEEDRKYYRLAVKQAETLYNIIATHPIFFEWSQDPLEIINTWSHEGFTAYILCSLGAFIFALGSVACASCKFAWIGRSDSVYDTAIYDNPAWMQGGNPTGGA